MLPLGDQYDQEYLGGYGYISTHIMGWMEENSRQCFIVTTTHVTILR